MLIVMKRGFSLYIREKTVKFLKIKNIISSVTGIFLIVVSVAIIISTISHYWGDWETIRTARSTPGSVTWFVAGTILLVWAIISKKMICDAYFYSSYFEGDLDGEIKYNDLTAITGKGIRSVKKQLHLFRKIYMKDYSFKTLNGSEYIELYSKKCICECRKCGAEIEKRIYFTGVCPYCKGSDLFAKVLTGNRFYSITNQISSDKQNPEFYSSKHLGIRKALSWCGLCFELTIFVVSLIACIDNIANYNNKEYLTDVLLSGKSYSSFALIKSEIKDTIIGFIALMVAMIPLICTTVLRLKYIFITDTCSGFLSRQKKPFVKVTSLPVYKKHGIKSIKGAICSHYLLNCSFEKHDNVMEVALARKIVKDECPTCGGPIVGAVDENYKCEYCGNMIMNVVVKK